MKTLFLYVIGLTTVLTTAGAATQPPTPPAEPAISLPGGVDLATVMRELDSQLPGVAVADASAVPQELERPVKDQPLSKALEHLSRDFDRYCIRRGRALALQRRYSDAEEDPGLEIEELRLSAERMYRLIQPYAPRLRGLPYILSKKEFVNSLSPQQQAVMLEKGLPLAGLTPEQRRLILEINVTASYDDAERELRRIALVMSRWDVAVMRSIPLAEFERHTFGVRVPDRGGPDGPETEIALGYPLLNRRPREPRVDVRTQPPHQGKLPEELRAVWRLPPQRTDLETLASELRADGGPKLEFPEYARERRFHVYSNGGTRGDVLLALTDLWGWELTRSDNGYRLALPDPGPATGAADLHHKLHSLARPTTVHLVRAVEERATERWGRQLDLIIQDADRSGGAGWQEIRPARLSAQSQRRLANLLAMRQVSTWFQRMGKRPEPLPTVLTPERGIIRLSGPLGPDRHPMLSFEVPTGGGKTSRWGWFVNTSSLDKKSGKTGDGK